MYIVTQLLPKKSKQAVEQAFISLDSDTDGKISKIDLIKAYETLFKDKEGIQAIVDKIMDALDISLNDNIEYSGNM